jgi:hypothetical protein
MPVLRIIVPELPLEVVPELKFNPPETPLSPAFAVLILNTPLDFDTPYPEIIEIAPPV